MEVPKVIHRIWLSWDPKKPTPSKLYQKYDLILKRLHPDWEFVEWDEEKVLNFVKEFYPEFLPIYTSYDIPLKRHDAARYLILKHYGGVFIQHSFHLSKNLEPLLEGSDFVIAEEIPNSINMAFLSSIPNHPLLEKVVNTLPETSKLHILEATGPRLITRIIKNYLLNNDDSTVAILDKKYLYPFDWAEKGDEPINSKCLKTHKDCFQLFPEAYAYTIWQASWMTQYPEKKKKKKRYKLF